MASPLYALYRGLTTLARPAAGMLLAWRARAGKEDASRIGERVGQARLPRPDGSLVWLHGASVGEGLALLPLAEKLAQRGMTALLTTGTVTSAAILASRLPPGALHQFVPLDVPRYWRRFLDHWRPDLVLVAESELWPNMIAAVAKQNIPLALVNARLSPRSFSRWQLLPGFIGAMLGEVDVCLAQTADDAARLRQLGAPRVQVAGNLKYDVDPPPADRAQLAALSATIGPRPVWFAASTHEGEEDIAAAAHGVLSSRFPTLLTIVAPRHVARGGAIATAARARGLNAVQRSTGDAIDAATQFYVADTMGEMGLFYRLANVVFVGKSLTGMGGQNPIEPARLGNAILHGPNVGNFAEVYAALDAARGAAKIADAETLARALTLLLSDVAMLRRMARAGQETVAGFGGATDKIMRAIEPYMMQMMVEAR